MPAAGWAPPPVKSGGRRKWLVVGVVVAIVVIIGAVVVANLRTGAGNVYFSKTAYDQSSTVCSFDAPITTASTGDSVYMIANLNDNLQAQDAYTIEVTKDGVSYLTSPLTADKEFNCYIEKSAVGPLPAGVWKFTITHNNKVEAEGTLTVK